MSQTDELDQVFHALAHADRRRILDILHERPGCAVGVLAQHFDVSRIAIMKHLTVLERAGLVISEKAGRSRRLYFNPVPIQLVYERWTDEYSALWASHVTALKHRIERQSDD
jgi:DNA-binding transcriptional ArsR family regulator